MVPGPIRQMQYKSVSQSLFPKNHKNFHSQCHNVVSHSDIFVWISAFHVDINQWDKTLAIAAELVNVQIIQEEMRGVLCRNIVWIKKYSLTATTRFTNTVVTGCRRKKTGSTWGFSTTVLMQCDKPRNISPSPTAAITVPGNAILSWYVVQVENYSFVLCEVPCQ